MVTIELEDNEINLIKQFQNETVYRNEIAHDSFWNGTAQRLIVKGYLENIEQIKFAQLGFACSCYGLTQKGLNY